MDRIKVADECWIALALLTRDHPHRSSFSSGEILNRIRKEHAHPNWRPGIQVHLNQHCVANREPGTGRYRMMYRLPDATLRLYRPGDDCHPGRTGKTHPLRADLPARYHRLIDWYEQVFCGGKTTEVVEEDPILALRGLGKELWRGTDPDAWVNDLRSHWDTADHYRPRAESTDDQILRRIIEHQGEEFRTRTNLPFHYEVEKKSGLWFYRQGRRIEQRLPIADIPAALKKWPLMKTTDLSEFRCPAYLFGLLTDPRIIGGLRG